MKIFKHKLDEINRKLSNPTFKKYGTRKTEWLDDEIHDRTKAMIDYTLYLSSYPEYDSAEIQFSLVKYKIEGKTVEFLTNGKLIQVHSESGWKDK